MACRLVGAKPLPEPNAGTLLIGTLGTHFSEIFIEIHTSSLKKMLFKVTSVKWRPFCLGLSVLGVPVVYMYADCLMHLCLIFTKRNVKIALNMCQFTGLDRLCEANTTYLKIGWPVKRFTTIATVYCPFDCSWKTLWSVDKPSWYFFWQTDSRWIWYAVARLHLEGSTLKTKSYWKHPTRSITV